MTSTILYFRNQVFQNYSSEIFKPDTKETINMFCRRHSSSFYKHVLEIRYPFHGYDTDLCQILCASHISSQLAVVSSKTFPVPLLWTMIGCIYCSNRF